MLKMSHNRAGYLVLLTDDKELIEHISGRKCEIPNGEPRPGSDSVEIRFIEKRQKTGSVLSATPDENGLHTISLKTPARARIPRFGMVEVKHKGSDPNFVLEEGLGFTVRLPKDPPPLKKMSKAHKPKPEPPELRVGERPRLKHLVEQVNAYKDEMGGDLVLSVDKDGRLKALIEY